MHPTARQFYHRLKTLQFRTSGGSNNFENGGGRQFISFVLIYRKCAQRNICPFTRKNGFLKKYEPMGGGAPLVLYWPAGMFDHSHVAA